jgi:hypothetical protein
VVVGSTIAIWALLFLNERQLTLKCAFANCPDIGGKVGDEEVKHLALKTVRIILEGKVTVVFMLDGRNHLLVSGYWSLSGTIILHCGKNSGTIRDAAN